MSTSICQMNLKVQHAYLIFNKKLSEEINNCCEGRIRRGKTCHCLNIRFSRIFSWTLKLLTYIVSKSMENSQSLYRFPFSVSKNGQLWCSTSLRVSRFTCLLKWLLITMRLNFITRVMVQKYKSVLFIWDSFFSGWWSGEDNPQE